MLNGRTTTKTKIIRPKASEDNCNSNHNFINSQLINLMNRSQSSTSYSSSISLVEKNIDAIKLFAKKQNQSSLINSRRTFLSQKNHHHHQLNYRCRHSQTNLDRPYYCKNNLIVETKLFKQLSAKEAKIKKGEGYKMINSKQINIYYKFKSLITMSSTILLIVLCAISLTPEFVLGDGYALSSLLQKMRVSPEIIKVPSYLNVIKVELNGNIVKPGDPIPAKNFKDLNLAKISWDVNNDEARHTLMLLDLDRKPNSTSSIYNQYTSINIPGHLIYTGQSIVSFEPPAVPCNPSIKHRILMLAFHQDQNIDIKDVSDIAASSGHSTRRENFKLNDFIRNHRLELVAANVFQAIGETNGICSSATSNLINMGHQYFFMMMISVTIAMVTISSKGVISGVTIR